MQANSLADLRARRAELNARLARGRDALSAKEDADDTGPEYERWLQAWLGLLCEYEGLCEQIDACSAQAATPAPTFPEIPRRRWRRPGGWACARRASAARPR